jgi:hypothetical protein
MAAPMKSPAAIFLLVICALALLVGAPRAAVEFGHRGLIAYAELVLTPAAFVAFAYLGVVPVRGRNGWVFFPPRHLALVIGWGLLIITTLFMVAAALFGVGSLVR